MLILLEQFHRYHDNDYEYHSHPNEEIRIDNRDELLHED